MTDDLPDLPAPRTVPSAVPPTDALTVAPSQPRAGLLLIRVLGELDLQSAPRCARVLHAAIASAAQEARIRDEHARVVCDLADVEFLGASGLGVLVDADEHARAAGVELVVVVGDGRIRRLVTLTGLDRRLLIASRLADAVPPPEAAVGTD